MVLNVSGRTDIVAFYLEWFMNRYKEGFVDVRNPFNPKMISRIYFNNVDLILFCTKNPIPLLKHIKEIKKPILLHVTITAYHKDIEVNVPDKKKVIEAVKALSKIIGPENIVIRYDPIFLNYKYNIRYHLNAFEKLCSLLEGYVSKIIISFIDECKNVENNAKVLKHKKFFENDYRVIGREFSRIASSHNLVVHTCYEDRDLVEYGFSKGECLSREVAFRLTGKVFKEEWKARGEKKCHCINMADIGVYNTCYHMCKYCYANYSESEVINNIKNHDPKSSLLIGHIESDDIIKERFK